MPSYKGPNWVICEGISALHLISQCYSHIMMDKLKVGNRRRQKEAWGDGLSGQLKKLDIYWSQLVDQFLVWEVRNLFSPLMVNKAVCARFIYMFFLLQTKAAIKAATSWRRKVNTTNEMSLKPTKNVTHQKSLLPVKPFFSVYHKYQPSDVSHYLPTPVVSYPDVRLKSNMTGIKNI